MPCQAEKLSGVMTSAAKRPSVLRLGAFITLTASIFVIALAVCDVAFAARASENTRRLCAECHKGIESYYASAVVHAPVAKGECASCHNPHASRHEVLLADSAERLCFECHNKRLISAGSVKHEPVEQGRCLDCHDPHAASSKGLLKKGGAEICYNCHSKDAVVGGKNVHAVVKKGDCFSCHSSHSSDHRGLLRKSSSEVCLSCHGKKGSSTPVGAHLGYDVAKSDCIDCHDPHSSDGKGMVRSKRHKPFESRECSACHVDPKVPGKLVSTTSALCLKCHKESLAGFNKRYSHLGTGVSQNLCLDCHSPHAGDEAFLPKMSYDKVCYACHMATESFVKGSKHKHPGLVRCFDCHSGHASDSRYFMKSGEKTCSTDKCHPAQGSFSHPQGEKILDPRSKEPMDCVSCHNPMGTFETYILKGERITGICQFCHKM